MTARLIPAATATVKVEDAPIDLVCFGHAFAVLGDRRLAGRLKGYVEATLDANPHLAAEGLILPRGTVVKLPEFAVADDQPEPSRRRLWDAD